MLEVKVYGADGIEETKRFDKSSVMIGRAPGNDICVDREGISRYHARLSREGESIVIQDLNSTNGTFVNAVRVESTAVSPTDRISMGTFVFSAEVVADGPAKDVLASAVIDAPPDPSTQFDLPPVRDQKNGSLAAAPEPPPPPAEGLSEPAQPAAAKPAEKVESADEKKASAQESFYWQSLKSFLAPVWEYIVDDSVSEIMINGPREIYIEKKGHLDRVEARFTTDQLAAAVLNIAQYVGRRVSDEEPYLDARLPDGSRVAVLVPPCSRKGVSLAIRKFAKEKLTIERLMDFGSISPEMVAYLRAAVLLKKNIIISGGTSSGKTSLLNVVSGLIPDDERIITIEDAAELQLRQDHVLPMETKPPDKKGRGQVTIRDLVRASLRMRPDRIVVGEIRSGEALDLLQAMNTGHSGSMATVHASSPQQALTRLETLALFSGLEIPVRALREQVSTAIEVVIQAARLPDHSRKVTHISEVNKLSESGDYRATDIFRFVREGTKPDGKIIGRHRWTGARSGMIEEMELAGLKDVLAIFESEPEPLPSGAQAVSGH